MLLHVTTSLGIAECPTPFIARHRFVLLFIVVLLGNGGCFSRRLEHLDHPNTGFPFPTASECAKVHLTIDTISSTQEFDAPEASWESLVSALTPSQFDPAPAAWQALLKLDIHTIQGQLVHIDCYDLGNEPIGAFSVEIQGSRKSYRGGNTERLLKAVVSAAICDIKEPVEKTK